MCTVSFLPLGHQKYMITSNRDDHPSRATSNIVEMKVEDKRVVFPQDPKAKGTWIAMSDHDQMAVLLNGAFEKHKHKPPYKESRGTMFLSYFKYDNMTHFLKEYNFEGMEPFTFIVFEKEKLHEIIWDETIIHHTNLPINEKKIWASCTLYAPDVKASRKDKFDASFVKQRDVDIDEIVDFHKGTGDEEDLVNGFLINRNDIVQTLSITNLSRTEEGILMSHKDLIGKEDSETQILTVN